MTPIFGKNAKIEILIVGVYYPIFCGHDLIFRDETEMVEASTLTSSIYKEWRPRMLQYSVEVTGLSKVNNSDGQIAYFWFIDPANRLAAQTLRLTYTDAENNSVTIGGTFFIQSSSLTGPAAAFSEASMTLYGTGAPVIPAASPPVIPGTTMLSDFWPVVNGQAYVDVSGVASVVNGYHMLNTDTVIDVWRSGSHLDPVTGTPGNAQCRFNTGLLRLEVDPTNPFNTGETLFIEFKR